MPGLRPDPSMSKTGRDQPDKSLQPQLLIVLLVRRRRRVPESEGERALFFSLNQGSIEREKEGEKEGEDVDGNTP